MAGDTVIERRVVHGRLAWFRRDAGRDFWEKHWRASLRPEFYARYRKGALGDFEKVFPKYLPLKGQIIEAGCGLGQYVVAMRARGYDMIGVDLASETIEGVRALLPDIPIICEDVTRLSATDNYYAGYVSLGVVEHLETGPEPFLIEACRVLQPGGTAIFTVPHFHALRKLKAKLGAYDGTASSYPFYQYAFTAEEFVGLLRQAGFEIEHVGAMNGLKGVRDEWPWFRRWYDRLGGNPLTWGILYLTRMLPFFDRLLGHMLLVVARKPQSQCGAS